MSGSDPEAKVLATQYSSHPEADIRPLFGAWVAVDSFLASLLRYGSWDRYEFFTQPTQREAARQRIQDIRPHGARVVDFSELRARGGDSGITTWLVTELDGTVPSHIRRLLGGAPFPITLLHHTVSYQPAIHRSFLQLLLDDPLPCDAIVCATDSARKSIEVLLATIAERFNQRHGTELKFRGRFETIPFGVDTDTLRPRDKLLARRELMLPTEPLVLLWLGRLSVHDKADLLPLLHAFADLKQYTRALGGGESRPLMLVIAGGDREQRQQPILEEQARTLGIASDVRFFPHVDAFRRGVFYGAADIFVAPTDNIQETFGITPIEAMACGVPQVVADWNGYRDTVVHEETGLRVPTLWMESDEDILANPFAWQDMTDHAALAQSVAVDPTQLRTSLMKLVLNDELRHRMAAASRKRAEEQFAWPRIIARMEALWEESHERARGLTIPSQALPDYRQPFYFDAFRHYASQIVTDDRRVRRSPSGEAALEVGDHLAPRYGDMDPAVLHAALEQIEDGGVEVAELLTKLRTAAGLSQPESLLRRQIMRLLKYGYAQLD